MQRNEAERSADVIVVGAGLAGLSAVRELEAAGLSCQVAEAQGRAGGRVRSSTGENGYPIEEGAQFLNQDMTGLVELVHEAGMELMVSSEGATAGLGASGVIGTDDWLGAMDEAWPDLVSYAGYQSGRPDRSVAELIQEITSDAKGAALMKSSLCELLCHELSDISAQGVLEIYARYDSQREDGECQVTGPLATVVARLVDGLLRVPHYHTAAMAVSRVAGPGGDAFDVATSHGAYRAGAVILAVPPVAAREIELPPPLADEVCAALESYIPGAMIKTTFVYRDAYWRQPADWHGGQPIREVVCIDPMGVTLTDTSRVGEDEARLTMFTGGGRAPDLAQLAQAERQSDAIDLLGQAFDDGKARQPIEMTDTVWVQHPWCGGGYNAHIRFGGMPDAAARLRGVEGRVLFACSEIAERFPSYMEGALDAGRSCAARLLRLLR
ncbi:flavin monoamine oxidase family protein [Halomonas chromatireducens]|uniref:Putrescine oxidase n=1 Tax=Halomonas chromatireducens TaxID=507626 RepID=A0A0X8HF36_9GAMM|nr:FAD-dependent oxidoreductase [Halomonas chromatireducens]AMD01420.1 Putrescine oxidase [Halomonas chromatireducens]